MSACAWYTHCSLGYTKRTVMKLAYHDLSEDQFERLVVAICS
ncbi:MAG: hypothetical protein WCF05_14970 [Chromatiaceae bacterium]